MKDIILMITSYSALPITHYTPIDVSYDNQEMTSPLIPIQLLQV